MYQDRSEPSLSVAVAPIPPGALADASRAESPSAIVRPGAPAAADGELALPDYLVRNYWWAYLWRPAVWFFDHQPIINSIVFGQYRKLVDATLRLLRPATAGSTLMIASAYGNVITRAARALGRQPLTVVDIAPIQLERARIKLDRLGIGDNVTLTRMNAEALSYERDSFDTGFMFLLLHELPDAPRRRALTEALRVLRPGGSLVLAEYGAEGRNHWFHRLGVFRWIFGSAEPFLPSLWRTDLDALLADCAKAQGKRVLSEEKVSLFGGFYRVWRYRVERS
ncbi:MAG: methyltransferase domain-containing protein [Lysobacterales bacterium]